MSLDVSIHSHKYSTAAAKGSNRLLATCEPSRHEAVPVVSRRAEGGLRAMREDGLPIENGRARYCHFEQM